METRWGEGNTRGALPMATWDRLTSTASSRAGGARLVRQRPRGVLGVPFMLAIPRSVPLASRLNVLVVSSRAFWLSASLLYAALCGASALRVAFSDEFIVQDDARQFIFWTARFADQSLFPHDLIADYFQSLSPIGYGAVFRVGLLLGLQPLVTSKILPFVLGLIASLFAFKLTLRLLPAPFAAFLAVVLLNHGIWTSSDVISATPRAFVYPLFLAFLYALVRRALVPMLATVALMGLFYPQIVILAGATLGAGAISWDRGRPRLRRFDLVFAGAGIAVAIAVLVPFALRSGPYGPTILADEARQLREFQPGGRSEFFFDNVWDDWVWGPRAGFVPEEWFEKSRLRLPLFVGLALPALLLARSRLALARQVRPSLIVLAQLLAASAALFVAAHLLLFRLHLPSRYAMHSLRIALAVAAGISLVILLDALWRWARRAAPGLRLRCALVGLAAAAVFANVLAFPLLLVAAGGSFPHPSYKVGQYADLYFFLRSQPTDILIASLDSEADFVPVFSQRSILVGREYAIPYQLGYYHQVSARAVELIRAQYSPRLDEMQGFIRRYEVTYLMLDRSALTSKYVELDRWIRQFEPETGVVRAIKGGQKPALAALMRRCSAFQTGRIVLLDAECILQAHD